CARLPLQFPRREPATLPRLAALRRVGAVVHLARATPTPSRPDACDDVEQLRHLARLLGPLGGELAPSARTTHARRRPRARQPPPRSRRVAAARTARRVRAPPHAATQARRSHA